MSANCRTVIESLAGFVDGALAVQAEVALRDHLAICPRCTEFLQSYRAIGSMSRISTDIGVPADLEQRLLAQLGVVTR